MGKKPSGAQARHLSPHPGESWERLLARLVEDKHVRCMCPQMSSVHRASQREVALGVLESRVDMGDPGRLRPPQEQSRDPASEVHEDSRK